MQSGKSVKSEQEVIGNCSALEKLELQIFFPLSVKYDEFKGDFIFFL